MKHELKIHPQYYARVADGSKTFELRKNDRGFQQGDIVVLKEWNPPYQDAVLGVNFDGQYTGNELTFEIGYVLPIDDKRWVVFSLLRFE